MAMVRKKIAHGCSSRRCADNTLRRIGGRAAEVPARPRDHRGQRRESGDDIPDEQQEYGRLRINIAKMTFCAMFVAADFGFSSIPFILLHINFDLEEPA